jgi:hypothetical protein
MAAFNWGNFINDLVTYGGSGAATGATVGSVVPGLGTGIGALVGGAAGLLGAGSKALATHDWRDTSSAGGAAGQESSNPNVSSLSTRTPEQNAAIKQLLPGTVKGIQSNKFEHGPLEQQAREGFQSKTLPSIAGKFIHSDNKANSSSLNAALANAGRGLENDLNASRQTYNLKQQELQQQQLGTLLRPANENLVNINGQQGFGRAFAEQLPELAKTGAEIYGQHKQEQAIAEAAAKQQKGSDLKKAQAAQNVLSRRSANQPINALQATQTPLTQPTSQPNVAAKPQSSQFNRFQTQVAGLTPNSYPSIIPNSNVNGVPTLRSGIPVNVAAKKFINS